MNIRPVRTEVDYQNALRELEAYFENEPALDSEEGDRFEILATLVEAYEARHYPIELPDPIEAIRFRMEQGGLTLEMICNLHRNLGIPAESLIGR